MPAADELQRGRASCARGAWLEGHDALSGADRSQPLGAEDLELLATAAYLLGRDEEYITHLERVHHLQLEAGEPLRAARAAFWIGMHLMLGGEMGRGGGWLGRAQRLIEGGPPECVERGLLLMPLAFQQEAAGNFDAAAATAGQGAAIAERFGDPELFALALHTQGHFLILGNRVAEGLGLLDEAMVAVTTGKVSPIATGIVYCGVIMGCQAAFEPRRAQEWTAVLTRWCERQPDMVAFSGRCHVHRAEIMHLKGDWAQALEEARCAERRAAQGRHRLALAEAAYLQGEVHRLRGDTSAAEAAYREASGYGREPYPGLALLRLTQGKVDAAVVALRRVLSETTAPADRARLLPAYVEILLAADDVDAASSACDELDALAAGHKGGVLTAMVAHARGAIDLAAGDAEAALPQLRRAWRIWEEIEAPYEVARVRALMGAACRALHDDDAATLELQAARRVLVELGATPDVARLDAPAGGEGAGKTAGLTARERQVLRLIAAGRTNKAIAAELVVSERTVDRHVSNIYVKLRVSSRAAATAYAYEHELV
jgi:DNA-binding CsgD family transcriptional regulator